MKAKSKQPPCDHKALRQAIWQSDDTIDPALEAHLSTCSACRQEIEALAANAGFWQRASTVLNETADLQPDLDEGSNGPQTSVLIQLDPRLSGPELHFVEDQQSVENLTTSHADAKALLDPPSHPEMLGLIDGFSVEQMIGRGGMGVVYKGFDSDLHRPVAIKFLSPHLAAHGVARKRFAREARAAAAVVHPNVVPIYSVNTSPVRPYLVMALVSGPSLQKHVQEQGPLPTKDVVRIGQQIAAGLAAAHEQGLIHRDIKPANILLENDASQAMITDFGLARAADDAVLTQSGWLAGTPHYMSPEQAMGDEIDQRSDLFSLGSVMYFLATGREPFRAEKPFAVLQKIALNCPQSIRSINSDVPVLLEDMINRLLEKDPEARFASATDTLDVMTRYLAHLQNPKMCPAPSVKKERPRPKVRTQFVAALVATIFIAVAATFFAQAIGGPQIPTSQKPRFISSNSQQNMRDFGASFDSGPDQTPTFLKDKQWQQDINALKKSIRTLQQPPPTRQPKPDPFDGRKRALSQKINQLRQRNKSN